MGGIAKGAKKLLFGSSPKVKYPDPKKMVLPRDDLLSSFYAHVFAPALGGSIITDDQNNIVGYSFPPEKLLSYKDDYLNKLKQTEGLLGSLVGSLQNLVPEHQNLASYSKSLLPDINYLKSIPEAPIIKTPFGEIPAYGLQRSALRNRQDYLKGLALGQALAEQTANLIGKQADLYSLIGNTALTALKPASVEYEVGYLTPLNMFLKEDLARYGVQATPIGISGSGGLLGSVLAGAGNALGGKLGNKIWGMIG